MRQRAGLFAGLLVVAAVTVGTAAAISGLLSTASTTGVRAVLAQQPGSERALRAALPLAGDSPAAVEQDRAAQATIRESFRDAAGRGVPSGIVRTVESASIVARGGRRTSVGLAEVSDLTSAATLEAGDWAGDASEATMQADAAAALGVGIGDTIVLDEQVELTIVGTWRVDDPDAPRWMGDALWITGGNERSVGPIVVEDTVWDELGITPQVRWTITPETERLAPSDLAAVDTAWETLPSAFRAAELGLPSLTGRFLLSARESQGLVAALQTAAPLALIVLGVLAALAIWELAGLLTRARSAETALLWARGATAHTLATVTAGEAACVAAAGALVGVAVAASLLFALPDALAPTLAAGAWAALVVATISAGAFALRTARSVGAGGRRGRAPRSIAAGAIALVTAAAIVATWQLLTNGPITITRAGRAEIDPLTLVAPALILAAIVLAALYLFPLVTRAAEAPAARGAGALTVLAVRGVARRAELAAVPIVMVGLAVGQLIVAGGYAATWAGAFTQSQELRFGTAVSLQGPTSGLADAELDAAGSASAHLAPVRIDSLLVGGERAAVVGVASRALAELGLSGNGTADPTTLATAIAPESRAVLPEAATTLSVAVSGTQDAAVSVWLSDDLGRLRSMPLETDPAADGVVGIAPLPDGEAPWTLAGVDVSPTATDAPRPLIVTSVTTDAGDLDGFTGSTAVFRNGLPVTGSGARGGSTAVAETGTVVRFLPPPPVGAVVLSEPLAERLGTRVGAPLTLDVDGVSVQTSVAAVAPAIPGADASSAILIDAAMMDAASLAREVRPRAAPVAWVGTAGDEREVATSLRSILPVSVRIAAIGEGPDRAMLAAGPAALWLSAGAGAVLAIAGLAAVCATQLRERRAETTVLRALGIPPRAQSSLRRRELAIVEAWAIFAGVVAGGAVVLLAVATLARTAVPGTNPAVATAVRLDLSSATVTIALLAVALFAVIAGYAAFVARSAAPGAAEEGTT